MNKDWTGNHQSVYRTLGASNHTADTRDEHDFYATDPVAIDVLCSVEKFDGGIWECAAGQGHLSKRLEQFGYAVTSTDLIDRGYGIGGVDFLKATDRIEPNIVTNPPYKFAKEFVYKALKLLHGDGKLALFLKLQFLEGKERKKMFIEYPPKVVYVSSSRILCAKNGDFEKMKQGGGSAVAYGWFVWQKSDMTETKIKWVN